MVSMHWFAHGLAFALVLPQVHSADVTTDGLWQLSGKHDPTWLFKGIVTCLAWASSSCTRWSVSAQSMNAKNRRGGSYPSLLGGLKRGSGVGASRRNDIVPAGMYELGSPRTAQGLLAASLCSYCVNEGGTRTCATPLSESDAIIVTQEHDVKRCVVLTADQGAMRGAIQRDVCSCAVALLRAVSAASAV